MNLVEELAEEVARKLDAHLGPKFDKLIAIGEKLMTAQQGKDLIAAVSDVKQAISDLSSVSVNLKAFHADTVIPPA